MLLGELLHGVRHSRLQQAASQRFYARYQPTPLALLTTSFQSSQTSELLRSRARFYRHPPKANGLQSRNLWTPTFDEFSSYNGTPFQSPTLPPQIGAAQMPQDTNFTTESLGALQSQEQLDLLNAMDKLRAYGVSEFVSLPQIVVCGDQSTGKSSVLEAITSLQFPRSENLCTRFATQLVLRRSPVSKVSVSILAPSGGNSAVIFDQPLQDFDQLPALIQAAEKALGLGGGATNATFARDVLNISISGPLQPHLTVVDLPGLIHSSAPQSAGDVHLVSSLVHTYMQNPRTIILAVISGSNDYQNQIVVQRAREVDPGGKRTLGVITKPDTIPAGSEKEAVFLALARNEEIPLKRGWHVLRNLGYEERIRGDTGEDRDRGEEDFFGAGAWRGIPRECCGVAALRTRLSRLLYEHIKAELPVVYADIRAGLDDCEKKLEALGEKRDSLSEQKAYITRLSMGFANVCKAGVEGQYEGYFVGGNEELVTAKPANRLRANIELLDCEFEKEIRTKGHAFEIVTALPSNDGNVDRYPHGVAGPKVVTKPKALEYVKTLLENNRGRELRGTYSPLIIGNLFWEHSKRWETIATSHVNQVFAACQEFLKAMVPGITNGNDEVSEALLKYCINEAMNNRLAAAQEELEKLFADRRKYPKTYNHYFTDTVQKSRQDAFRANFTEIGKQYGYSADQYNTAASVVPKIIDSFAEKTEVDMEKYACEQVLRNMLAYYKVASKTFVDNVAIQVIERHLLDGLWDDFSPMTVIKMSDELIEKIVGESPGNKELRKCLELKKESLTKGLETCRNILPGIETA